MSLNKYMHPRNIYRTPPNFKQMAIDYPEFRKYVKQELSGKIKIDFKDHEALCSLSRTLLKKDFDLDVNIPVDRLIPTIPLRLNYILWIEDLLSISGDGMDNIHGIDIGTGASCVYPLLASKKCNWHMTATEIDVESLNLAQVNVSRNNLQHLIQLIHNTGSTLLKDLIDPNKTYNFCMCNPPFFSSINELDPFSKARTAYRPLPRNAFTGKTTEVVSNGGEVQFISKLINESIELKSNVRIFTTMIGHKSSVAPLKLLLRNINVTCFKQTEFHQGHTTRWGLAWTFQDIDLRKIPEQAIAATAAKKKPKPPLDYVLPDCGETISLDQIVEKVRDMLQTLRVDYEEIKKSQNMYAFQVTAKENTWSHQRRKRREKLRKHQQHEDNDTDANNMSSDFDNSLLSMDIDVNTSTESNGHSNKRNRSDISDNNDDDADEKEYFHAKKIKNYTTEESKIYLRMNLVLRKFDTEYHLELNWIDGICGWDAVHQVMQYFKNNYK